jgi:hypothetical protein
VPHILVLADQIVHQVGLSRFDPETVHRKTHPARLHAKRIEIDDDHDDIRKIGRGFYIKQKVVVVDIEKLHVPRRLKGGVFAADSIDKCDQIVNAVGTADLPTFDFKLFGSLVFFAVGQGVGDAQFIRRSVNAVI